MTWNHPPFTHRTRPHSRTYTPLWVNLPSLTCRLFCAPLFVSENLEVLQAAESFFSSSLMWRERLVLPGRQKRRRNEGNERISRFLLRSEGGVLGCFWQTAQERQPMVQFHAVKSYSYPTYTSSAYRVMHCGVKKRYVPVFFFEVPSKEQHIMYKLKHAAAAIGCHVTAGSPLGDRHPVPPSHCVCRAASYIQQTVSFTRDMSYTLCPPSHLSSHVHPSRVFYLATLRPQAFLTHSTPSFSLQRPPNPSSSAFHSALYITQLITPSWWTVLKSTDNFVAYTFLAPNAWH